MQIAGIVLAVGAGLIWPVVERYDPDNVKVLYLCAAAVLAGFGLMAAVAHGQALSRVLQAMSVDLNNLLQYQRQFHQNLTTKSTKRNNSAKAVAQADELFATPKKKPDYVSGGEIIKRSELEYERAIQRQREQRLERDSANPPNDDQTTTAAAMES